LGLGLNSRVYKHQTGQPLLETPHRELTDLPSIKLTEMFN